MTRREAAPPCYPPLVRHFPAGLLLFAALGACGDASEDGRPRRGRLDPPDSGTRDTAEDTAAPDTAPSDSAPADTSASDTADAACPAPPGDLVTVVLPDGYGHPTAVRLYSGQTATIPLPAVPDSHVSEQIVWSESPSVESPQPVTLEISIGRCPGVVDTDTTNYCNLASTNGHYNAITYLARAYLTLDDAASAAAYGYCWAPAEDGPWYANMRWTYVGCAYGGATCGFMAQLNLGPY